MMPEKFKRDTLEITLSKEARKLVKWQQYLENRMQNECMPVIKECLVRKTDIFKNIKGIGAVKNLSKRSKAKISALSEIKLYSQAEQVKIKSELSNSSIFSEKVKIIENCFYNYNSIELETVCDARKKALIMRPLLEACLIKLVNKSKIDPEHIGAEYAKATKNGDKNIRKYAVRLQELYRITCKYHHGMKSGSTLGISWINSDEIEFMDNELQEIMEFIEGQGRLSESA